MNSADVFHQMGSMSPKDFYRQVDALEQPLREDDTPPESLAAITFRRFEIESRGDGESADFRVKIELPGAITVAVEMPLLPEEERIVVALRARLERRIMTLLRDTSSGVPTIPEWMSPPV